MSDAWVRDFIAAAESGHAGRTLELVEAVRKERWAVKEAAHFGMAALKASLERETPAGRNRVLRQWLAKFKDQVIPAWSQLGFPSPPKNVEDVDCAVQGLNPSYIPFKSAGPQPIQHQSSPAVPAAVIVFDFDQTLSTRHVGVFEDMARIGERAFGGPERVQMLRDLLSELSESATIAVVSRNSRYVINKVLQNLELSRFFAASLIFGFEDFGDEIPKSSVILKHILPALSLPASRGIFVDDDPSNVAEVQSNIPGIATLKCPRFGLGSQECRRILEQLEARSDKR